MNRDWRSVNCTWLVVGRILGHRIVVCGILMNANVSWGFGRLCYLIASPKFHRWHHTSEDEGLDKNFAGLFPLFDVLFGTYYMPEDRLPEQFGLNKDDAQQTFWGQMISPFRTV